MAQVAFNIALGRDVQLVRNVCENNPANAGILVTLLQVAESDALMKDRETLAAVLANSTECTFTNYAPKILTNAELTLPTPNHTNDTYAWSTPAVQWVSGGGAVNNSIVKTVFSYCPDVTAIVEANCIPLTAHDAAQTTDGNNVELPAGVVNTNSQIVV